MCIFTGYMFSCGHDAVLRPFCTDPCPGYTEFAVNGLREPKNRCPNFDVEFITLDRPCEDCNTSMEFDQPGTSAAGGAAATGDDHDERYDRTWHIPQGEAVVDHLRTTDPFAADRAAVMAKAKEDRKGKEVARNPELSNLPKSKQARVEKRRRKQEQGKPQQEKERRQRLEEKDDRDSDASPRGITKR